jgi:hypothetical protein
MVVTLSMGEKFADIGILEGGDIVAGAFGPAKAAVVHDLLVADKLVVAGMGNGHGFPGIVDLVAEKTIKVKAAGNDRG